GIEPPGIGKHNLHHTPRMIEITALKTNKNIAQSKIKCKTEGATGTSRYPRHYLIFMTHNQVI
ncbi:MAG: hypothetical protein M0Z58_02985, partial [Nitrospiraceae bacterium]|nr:hypothetical protein [Nitrospiraceae bacterium]